MSCLPRGGKKKKWERGPLKHLPHPIRGGKGPINHSQNDLLPSSKALTVTQKKMSMSSRECEHLRDGDRDRSVERTG